MNYGKRLVRWVSLIALCALGACASLPDDIIAKPDVELSDVQVVGLGFKNQTFLLSFNVNNPNPFTLPVSSVSYGVRLDGLRFASGETPSAFSIPAGGAARFAISVELDLLTTAPQLLAILQQGARRDIPYVLEGRLGIDLPTAPAVSYRTDGSVRLDTGGF